MINTNGGYLDAGVKLKNTFGWDNKNGSNESGFAANAGGDRAWNTSLFSSLRKYGFWWTSSVEKEIRAKEIGKPTIYGEVFVHYGIGKDRIFKSGVGEQGRGDGTSVRLIKE